MKIAKKLLDRDYNISDLVNDDKFIFYMIPAGDAKLIELYMRVNQFSECSTRRPLTRRRELAISLLEPHFLIIRQNLEKLTYNAKKRWIQHFDNTWFLVDVNQLDDNLKTPLHYASSKKMAELLIQHGSRPSYNCPLDTIAANGREQVVSALLEWNLLDERSYTSALRSASTGRIAKLLIDRGADINAMDGRGWTALHYAAYGDRQDVLSILIEHGADVDSKSATGETALHLASRKAVAEILLINGADVDARVLGGHTPLHDAAGRARRRLVSTMLQYGANPDLVTDSGRKAADYSQEMAEYIAKCVDELNRMKKHMLYFNWSLCDMLTIRDPRYVLNTDLVKKIESVRGKDYPIYMMQVRAKLNQHRQRMELLAGGANSLRILIEAGEFLANLTIPDELLMKIVVQLRARDINALKLCSESVEERLNIAAHCKGASCTTKEDDFGEPDRKKIRE